MMSEIILLILIENYIDVCTDCSGIQFWVLKSVMFLSFDDLKNIIKIKHLWSGKKFK